MPPWKRKCFKQGGGEMEEEKDCVWQSLIIDLTIANTFLSPTTSMFQKHTAFLKGRESEREREREREREKERKREAELSKDE